MGQDSFPVFATVDGLLQCCYGVARVYSRFHSVGHHFIPYGVYDSSLIREESLVSTSSVTKQASCL